MALHCYVIRGNYMILRTCRCLANCAFAIAVPFSRNCLTDNVRNCHSYSNFLSKLKTIITLHFFDHVICWMYYFNNTLYSASQLQMGGGAS